MIIGITGLIGSGKTTVGQILLDIALGAKTIAFAEPLKRFVSEIYDWPLDALEDQEFKATPDPRYVWKSKHAADSMDPGAFTPQEWECHLTCKDVFLTPRRALQTLGTQWGRNCCESTWVRLCLRRVHEALSAPGCDLVVVTDCRFDNEGEAIRAAGGEVWRVERLGTLGSTHASEAGVAIVDRIISNNGSLEDLEYNVRLAMRLHSARVAVSRVDLALQP